MSSATPHLFSYQPRHRFLSAWDLAPNPTIYLSARNIGQSMNNSPSSYHHNSSSDILENKNKLSLPQHSSQSLLTNN
ncbi:unnamed protein product, partial [Didymodactylos carnosus]